MKGLKTACVLVGHRVPPSDFPKTELLEYFRLHLQAEAGALPENLRVRYAQLDERIKRWPRTPENDPYKAGLEQLARGLETGSGLRVFLAFNEFCAPTLEEAVEQAVQQEFQRIIVVPTMLIRGGVHSERDIPTALAQAQTRFPKVKIVYAWPFEDDEVIMFFRKQLLSFATA